MEENPPKAILAEVDLSGAWDKESMRDLIIERLKELGIYTPNLLFRGVDGSALELIKTAGTDCPLNSSIFCSTEAELIDESGIENATALNYTQGDNALLTVYNGEKLNSSGIFTYRPKKGTSYKEAILAVLSFKK